jgi:hypothetical protein
MIWKKKYLESEKMKAKPDGIVLWHIDGMMSFKAFDVFVRKDKLKKYKKEFEWLYKVDCLFAEAFTELFKEYKWIGSEDDLHAFPMNFRFPRGFKILTLYYFPKELKREEEKERIKEALKRNVGRFNEL